MLVQLEDIFQNVFHCSPPSVIFALTFLPHPLAQICELLVISEF